MRNCVGEETRVEREVQPIDCGEIVWLFSDDVQQSHDLWRRSTNQMVQVGAPISQCRKCTGLHSALH